MLFRSLIGIGEQNWTKVNSIVVEVHDENGRLNQVKTLLQDKGFNRITVEQEEGLENSKMYNLFALQ